ncbi:MAG: hypothetical protein LBU66_03210 [Treponema sp.]|jgi:hypothetical protein|nr:hypothetical protein [Treponema sp.]
MQTNDFKLNILINGAVIEKRPSSFSLITDEGISSVMSVLVFSADSGVGESGDQVKIFLSLDGKEHLLFTGNIMTAGIGGAYRNLVLSDGFSKLIKTSVVAAYRKETAKAILQDTLDGAGIDKTAITCPDVEIARFSTEKISAYLCIKLLVKTLEEHGYTGFRFFFDNEDVFRFGTINDTGKNDGAVYEFTTGKNILKKNDNRIEALPLPIRHSQEVMVDGVKLIVSRTAFTISGLHSRLALFLRSPQEAA